MYCWNGRTPIRPRYGKLERCKNVIGNDVIVHNHDTCFVVCWLVGPRCVLAIRRGNIARAHATMRSLTAVCALVAGRGLA